eukprot:320207-Rhodomonas_salina.1
MVRSRSTRYRIAAYVVAQYPTSRSMISYVSNGHRIAPCPSAVPGIATRYLEDGYARNDRAVKVVTRYDVADTDNLVA